MVRVEMPFPELPFYLTVFKVIDKETDSVRIEIESRIHVNRCVKLPMQYSTGYVERYPERVSGDITSFAIKAYDLKREPTRYM